MNGEWSMVGVDLGFPPVSCGDPHPLAHCTPVVAHQLHQLYQDTLRHFDQAYNRGTINQNQLEYLGRPQALQRHYQPLAYQPTEADFHTLLATIATSESSPFQTYEDAKNILPMFCDVSAAELGAHRVPQHVIAYIEHNREYLKRLAQNPRSFTGFTPVGSPQFVHQNPFRVNDVQAIPDPSLHSPQNRPQMQEGGMNLSLSQQQVCVPQLAISSVVSIKISVTSTFSFVVCHWVAFLRCVRLCPLSSAHASAHGSWAPCA